MTDWETEKFIPQRVGDKYITFLLEYSHCYICSKNMIVKPRYEKPFPAWMKIDFDTQVEKANLVVQSNVLVDNHYICLDCVKQGKADFLCALCKMRKETGKIKDWIGSPAEFLCWDCFESVSAAIWAAKINALHEDHRYDSL